jgi:hypothetical protein
VDELALCVAVVASGWESERMAGVGNEFAENRRGNVMWRDYGVVEVFWEPEARDAPWRWDHVTVQVHRLASRGVTLAWERLRAGLAGVEVPGAADGVVGVGAGRRGR